MASEYTIADLTRIVERAGDQATEAAGRAFIRLVTPFVPTSGGKLSDGASSLRGNLLSNGVTIGRDNAGRFALIKIDTPYALDQYNNAWRHFFIGQDKPGIIGRFAQTAVIKKEKTTGRGGAVVKPRSARKRGKSGEHTDAGHYLYGVAYRYAIKHNLLSRAFYGGKPGLRWFEKVADNPQSQAQIRKIFVGTITGLLG